jgi:hypothetical protein
MLCQLSSSSFHSPVKRRVSLPSLRSLLQYSATRSFAFLRILSFSIVDCSPFIIFPVNIRQYPVYDRILNAYNMAQVGQSFNGRISIYLTELLQLLNALITLLGLYISLVQAVRPIVVKGSDFVNSVTGDRLQIIGVAYVLHIIQYQAGLTQGLLAINQVAPPASIQVQPP